MKTKKYRVVIDTNVFITSLKSRRGASFKLLFDTDRDRFTQIISATLMFEYDSVAKRKEMNLTITHKDIDIIIDKICQLCEHSKVFFLWRPFLKDPRDDLILELAIESNSNYIVTFNTKDFKGIEEFGIQVITPIAFLEKIGG